MILQINLILGRLFNKMAKEKKEKNHVEEEFPRAKKNDNIELENAKEEIREIVDKCIKCGLCKSRCPVFKTLYEEANSPRGRATLLEEGVYDKIVFQCNLCKACEDKCPLKLKIWEAVRKSREVLVLEGKELKENKEMIKNIRETGNPFGKNPEKAEKLYCC